MLWWWVTPPRTGCRGPGGPAWMCPRSDIQELAYWHGNVAGPHRARGADSPSLRNQRRALAERSCPIRGPG